LKFAHEPNLANRLYDVINGGPITIERKSLLIFVNRCAEIRNDISHFGEQRSQGSREGYMQEVYQKARALSVLYHAIILDEIGIDREIINEWIYGRSNGAATLVGAGLPNGST
jgi:HEPN superfamily Apea-like protein